MIFIASDHGGFKLKNEIIKYLQSLQLEVTDLGPAEYVEDDDYPDYTVPLAQKVAAQTDGKGILICRNGVGVSMLANKIKGVRAALSWNPGHAASSRKDDNTNVLALAADYTDLETTLKIIDSWLSTDFSNETRHRRRLEKVARFEEQI